MALSLPTWSFWSGTLLYLLELSSGCKTLQRCRWSILPDCQAIAPLLGLVTARDSRQTEHGRQQGIVLCSQQLLFNLCFSPSFTTLFLACLRSALPFCSLRHSVHAQDHSFPKAFDIGTCDPEHFEVIYFLLCHKPLLGADVQNLLLVQMRQGTVSNLKCYIHSA